MADRKYLHKWDSSHYKRAYLWGGPLEASVQADIVDALRTSRIDVEVVDSGSKGLRGKLSRVLAGLHLALPVVQQIMNAIRSTGGAADAGRADLSGCLAPDGKAFYIEVKMPAKLDPTTGKVLRSAGRPAPEQLDFLDKRAMEGAIVGVAWSIDDAFEILGSDRVLAHQRAVRNAPVEESRQAPLPF